MTPLPPGLLLFDTGIYIRSSRGEDYFWLGNDANIFKRTVMTAVVAAEMYAGTRRLQEKRTLDRLCQLYDRLGHLSSPPASAWVEAGLLLRRGKDMFGEMDFVRHFRDILIALESVRAQATLVTENYRDFVRWKRLLAITGKTLKLHHPSA